MCPKGADVRQASTILLLIIMFVPWANFGIEPLVAGFIPRWVAAMLVPNILFIIVMLFVLRRAEQ